MARQAEQIELNRGGSDEVDACSGAFGKAHMESWGIYEATRRKAEQLSAEQRGKSEPPQTEFAIGSLHRRLYVQCPPVAPRA